MVLLMMPLSGAPPEDKNTVSRADNSKSENFFRFLGTLAFSSDSSSTRLFDFFAFAP